MAFSDNAVLVRVGIDFANATSFHLWDENSPLPPGIRYVELADIYAELAVDWYTFPNLNKVTILNLDESILPVDSFGNIRRNLKPCGVDVSSFNGQTLDTIPSAPSIAAELAAIYSDDTMWTGEVVDPVIWQDDWWDHLFINHDRMQIYLDAHSGCRLNA